MPKSSTPAIEPAVEAAGHRIQRHTANHSILCQFRRVFFGARTRILAWYVILMASSTLISILAIREILLARLQERVEKSVVLEVQELYQLMKGRDPYTGEPFGKDIAAVFDVFLSRNITEEGEYFLTILEGKLYKASSTALPEPLQANSAFVRRLSQLSQAEQGQLDTPFGEILYWAEPIELENSAKQSSETPSTSTVFVVARVASAEQQSVLEAIAVVAKVSFAVLGVASILAWLVAGRILSPLRSLTDTARSISDSDLSQRISVEGADEIAEMAKTFNEMLERLQVAFTNQRDFINDVGHELRTPITIIRGHLEFMGDEPQSRQATLDLVSDELDRMTRLVEDLLLLAKAEQPNFLNLETVDVDALTKELYSKAVALSDRHWQLDCVATGRIVADRQRVTQMVMNLTQNATQHTQPGDVIALGSAALNKEVYFWVRDTGCGIAPAKQKHIFERFVSLSRSDRRDEGTGLGLAIVDAIVRAHGGRIELTSTPGQGSTFTIVLPFDPPQRTLRS